MTKKHTCTFFIASPSSSFAGAVDRRSMLHHREQQTPVLVEQQRHAQKLTHLRSSPGNSQPCNALPLPSPGHFEASVSVASRSPFMAGYLLALLGDHLKVHCDDGRVLLDLQLQMGQHLKRSNPMRSKQRTSCSPKISARCGETRRQALSKKAESAT